MRLDGGQTWAAESGDRARSGAWLALLVAALLAADLLWSQGLVSGAPYVLLVAFSLRQGRTRVTLRMALLASALTAVGLLRARPGVSPMEEFLLRALVVAVIWRVAAEGIRLQRLCGRSGPTPAPEAADEPAGAILAPGEAQKLVLQAELTRGAMHSINNMLMVIQSAQEELRDRAGGPENQAALGDLEAATAEIGAACDRLNQFARLSGAGGEGTGLYRALVEAVPTMRYLLPRSVAVGPLPPAPEVEIVTTARADELFRAILNLGLLAREALPRGGEIRFELTTGGPRTENAATGSMTRLTLDLVNSRDQESVSLPREAGASDRLRRALQAIRDLAGCHGGRFEARGKPEGGLQLALALPGRPVVRPSSVGVEGMVLLIDPHDFTRSMTSGALRDAGVEVAAYRTADEALRSWNAHERRPRAIVMDEAVFEEVGEERIAALPEFESDGRLILIGGGQREGPPIHRIGGVHRLRKPYAMGDLTALARSTLQAEQRKEQRP